MQSAKFVIAMAGLGLAAAQAQGAIFSSVAPAALDFAMGTPLLVVPGDGSPLGAIYGHPPSLTPGMPLATPIGSMGFMPSHDRVAPGTPFMSGAFHALPIGAPGGIAGSDVVPPVGATAIDFFLEAESGSTHSFSITAVGTLSSHTIVVPGVTPGAPVYVGFGAVGETLVDISIVKLPFPTTTMLTWVVSDIRVLPSPGVATLLLGAGLMGIRRKR